jgi:hypothetical protein
MKGLEVVAGNGFLEPAHIILCKDLGEPQRLFAAIRSVGVHVQPGRGTDSPPRHVYTTGIALRFRPTFILACGTLRSIHLPS